MPTTCPQPITLNPLQTNGFIFSINKLPNLQYFCQEANIPSISLPDAQVSSPLSNMALAGDKVTFEPLNVTFQVNEDLSNYMAIWNWMIGIGFPQLHEQYAKFISENSGNLVNTPNMATYSDANLTILNSSNNPVATITFVDILPVSLGSLAFKSNTDGTMYLMCDCTFRYTYYYFA